MENKQIIIDGINVSELTNEQLVCMNRYEVARLFAKLVDTLSETEDDYNNAQEDRVRMWTDNTDLTEKLKAKKRECEKYKQTLTEVKEIAKEQTPYFNIDKAKTMIEIEYDYTGKMYNLEQRMYKILQKLIEVLND